MTAESHILAAWARLGIAWNIPPARQTPHMETLLVQSMAFIPSNARLAVLIANWLSVYWRCVGRDSLRGLAQHASPRDQATLGILLDTADQWLPTPIFRGLTRRLSPMATPQPLLLTDQTRPALARLAELEASPISRHWGLWCLPIEPKRNAIRPSSWVLKTNPALRFRSLFKGSLKTSLLSALETLDPSAATVTALSRQCHVTRKAVYEALDDLQFSGMHYTASHNEQPTRSRGR